ncbi:hypothetical protein [Endozoicomonas atrinae]|uniref:hypothetical protein n=1 Tax=Endozoicomonas atrinae TaxID=1333660 RepID=UPI003B00FBBD
MEKAWAIIIDDDQAACMMAIPRLFEQLRSTMGFTCLRSGEMMFFRVANRIIIVNNK